MKRSEPYQGIALRKKFIELIKEHIKDKSEYSTVTSFIRYATLKQMENEREDSHSLEKQLENYKKYLETLG